MSSPLSHDEQRRRSVALQVRARKIFNAVAAACLCAELRSMTKDVWLTSLFDTSFAPTGTRSLFLRMFDQLIYDAQRLCRLRLLSIISCVNQFCCCCCCCCWQWHARQSALSERVRTVPARWPASGMYSKDISTLCPWWRITSWGAQEGRPGSNSSSWTRGGAAAAAAAALA